MRNEAKRLVRKVKTGRTALGVLTILLVLVLAVAGCGEAATATPEPAPSTAVPQPTPTTPPSEPATSVPDPAATATTEPSEPDAPTAVPPTTVPPTAIPATPEPTLRARSEWTPENPATLEEIEAELEKYRGSTVLLRHAGGAYGGALRQAYLDPAGGEVRAEHNRRQSFTDYRRDLDSGRDRQHQVASHRHGNRPGCHSYSSECPG